MSIIMSISTFCLRRQASSSWALPGPAQRSLCHRMDCPRAWPAGGSCAIVLKDPNDKATLAKVKALLESAKAKPEYGIETILTHNELVKRGGFPNASFLVDFRDTYAFTNKLNGPVVEEDPSTGTHGYLPSRPDLRSTFMIQGEGIAKNRDLHVIDMRQIAPTFAQLLNVKLPEAKLQPVNVKP